MYELGTRNLIWIALLSYRYWNMNMSLYILKVPQKMACVKLTTSSNF